MLWTMHRAALFPARVRIGGWRLRPPTVRQWLLLECVCSPYAGAGGGATPGDMAIAIALCALPHWAGRWAVRHPRALRFVADLVALRACRAPWGETSAALVEWLTQCNWRPDRFAKSGESAAQPVCTPFAVRLACRLARRMPMRDAWRLPLPVALLYAVAMDENDGGEYVTLDEYARLGVPEELQYLPLDLKQEWERRRKAAQAEAEAVKTEEAVA